MPRFLRSVRLALHPAQTIYQRFPKAPFPGRSNPDKPLIKFQIKFVGLKRDEISVDKPQVKNRRSFV
jgi:hypothetical protein